MTDDSTGATTHIPVGWKSLLSVWRQENSDLAEPFQWLIDEVEAAEKDQLKRDDILNPIAQRCRANPNRASALLAAELRKYETQATLREQPDPASSSQKQASDAKADTAKQAPPRTGSADPAELSLLAKCRAFVADPINAAVASVVTCILIVTPYIWNLKSQIFRLEMKSLTTRFDTQALTAFRVGPHTFDDIKLIGETYRLRDGDYPGYLLDIRDHSKIAAFYLCQQIETPTIVATKSGEPLITTEGRPAATGGLEGTPVRHQPVSMHCTYHRTAEMKIGTVERPQRFYPFSGDEKWGPLFSNDDRTRQPLGFDLRTGRRDDGKPVDPPKK